MVLYETMKTDRFPENELYLSGILQAPDMSRSLSELTPEDEFPSSGELALALKPGEGNNAFPCPFFVFDDDDDDDDDLDEEDNFDDMEDDFEDDFGDDEFDDDDDDYEEEGDDYDYEDDVDYDDFDE
ncbi:MAG: hypothetical protein LBQ38_03090 [Spirochaetaceae bacterium]|jgi:hypothetical protein|nr:hypothetical protein [Spirochaetaceae bacterium]